MKEVTWSSLTIRLPRELRRQLEAAAERDHRTVSNFVRHHLGKLPALKVVVPFDSQPAEAAEEAGIPS